MKATIQYKLQHFDALFNFSAEKPFLKWRFTTFVRSQKALEYIAKKVVDNKKTLIGFVIGLNKMGLLKDTENHH